MDTIKTQSFFTPLATLQNVPTINNFIKSLTKNEWMMNDKMKDKSHKTPFIPLSKNIPLRTACLILLLYCLKVVPIVMVIYD